MAKFDNLINNPANRNPQKDNKISKNVAPVATDREYTDEELLDVNAITVTIPDTETPIVVFFGSQASGKTLALMRMIRYLEENDYGVVPEEVFRPKTDEHYTRMCKELKDHTYSQYTPGGNDVISFMLVKVLERGRPVCQILEAPGEHYFDGTANLEFPTYINRIRTAPNRKVWVFFVEQGWGVDSSERNLYAQKIRSMQSLVSPRDKVVFLFNKADKYRDKGQYDSNGRPIVETFFNNIKQQYPGIFDRYSNTGLLKALYGKYNFKAVCFSAGTFNDTTSGREVWTPEADFYCADLWKHLH